MSEKIKHSILIIEDDPSYRSMMELILRMEGFAVRAADDGESGLELLREQRSDLILCDIMMPDMDGYSVLETLRGESRLADIPFIFVTAMGERLDVRRGMSAGADDYLSKPFVADELLAAVTGRLRRHGMIAVSQATSVFRKERDILNSKTTRREREVLLLVGQGITSREIARRLGVGEKTIEVHRANLMHKLDAPNAASLARWAVIAEQMERD